jgi:Arc/MetJ-type ribon-helix-helix transcriptional regulator
VTNWETHIMTIHLPKDVESSINAEVQSGHFASAEEAVTVIVREYFQRQEQQASPPPDDRQEPPAAARKPVWERILERTAAIPDEEWDKLPTDLAEQHDHYLYVTPKRPTA